MHCAIKTDVGRHRSSNEDRYGVDAGLGILVIADGMGGHERGEVASRLAVETALDFLRRGLAVPPSAAQEVDMLRSAALLAHRRVLLENANAGGRRAMGTTLIVASIRERNLHYAHVGDSRLYVISPSGGIEQLTRDQTLAQQLRDRGEDPARITAQENASLLQAVGLEGFIVPATGSRRLGDGETLLLCTDGLSDLVADAEMAATLTSCDGDLERAAEDLVERANAAGGLDNITVVIARP